MDIRAALKLPKREAKFKPSREGLSAAQTILEMERWYAGMPQDPDMDWQVRGIHMAETGRRQSGPWSCRACQQEAVHEPTPRDDYFIHKCPLWTLPAAKGRLAPNWANLRVDDGLDAWIKRHDMRSEA